MLRNYRLAMSLTKSVSERFRMTSAIDAFTVAGPSLLRNRNEELWVGWKIGKHAEECSLLRIELQDLLGESATNVQDVVAHGDGTGGAEPAITRCYQLTDLSGFHNQFPHTVDLVVGDQEFATIGGKHDLNWMFKSSGGGHLAADVSASDGVMGSDPRALAVTHVQQAIRSEREAAHQAKPFGRLLIVGNHGARRQRSKFFKTTGHRERFAGVAATKSVVARDGVRILI